MTQLLFKADVNDCSKEETTEQSMVPFQNGACDSGGHEDSGFDSNFIGKPNSSQDLNGPEMGLAEREQAKWSHLADEMEVLELSGFTRPSLQPPSLPPSRPITSTPMNQTKRRSSFTIREPALNASPIQSSIRRVPSLRLSVSVAKNSGMSNVNLRADYSEIGRACAGQLVTHTVAERRARAEALDAERQRTRQAKLAASEAALEAAYQRVQSLRAARSAKIRVRQEERRIKVAERRKMLEKHREELLNRRALRSTGSPHSPNERLLRQAPSKVSICGFSSELDPSDPRYCPFGFGSSSRRDVCLSTKQQLIGLKTLTMTKLSTSLISDSQSKLNISAPAMSSSMHAGGRRAIVDRSINSTAPQLISKKEKNNVSPESLSALRIPNSCKASNNQNALNKSNNRSLSSTYSLGSGSNTKPSAEVSSVPCSARALQTATVKSSDTFRPVIPPSSIPQGKPPSIRSVKNITSKAHLVSKSGQKSVRGRCGTTRATQATTKSSKIAVSASCESSKTEIQAYPESINEQRKLVQERKRLEEEEAAILQHEEEMNDQLEAMARITVDEAICLAVAELKAEAVEASATVSGKGTVACIAAQLLSDLSNNNGGDLKGVTPSGKTGDSESLLESALATSKKVLNRAVEKMALSANTDHIRKSQSEIITVLAKATSDVSDREKRRTRLDEIMNRVQTSSVNNNSNNPTTLTAPLSITVNCVNSVTGGDKKRCCLRPCGAIKSMLESGRLPTNCEAAILLRNRVARYEQMPPLELCSPCTENSSIGEFEPRSAINHS